MHELYFLGMDIVEETRAISKFNTILCTDDMSESEKVAVNQKLSQGINKLIAIGEAYPELKANENFLALQTELAGTEDKVAYSRQFYNDTVQMYNTAIMKFPNNLVAGMFGHKEEPFFTIDEAEKEPVKVQF